MPKKSLKKSTIKFVEENKDMLRTIAKYGISPSRDMAAVLLTAYNREKRRKRR